MTEDVKKAYNDAVKKACRWRDEAMMKEEMEKMKEKKMWKIYCENLETKEYVKKGSLYSARRTWEVIEPHAGCCRKLPRAKKV